MDTAGRIGRLALGSLAVGLTVLGLKAVAWKLTGSVALYSDALESIINVAAAGAAWLAVRVAALPADDNHPYGHHKAEYFSAVVEAVLIVLAALAIAHAAWAGLWAPRMPEFSAVGLGVNVLASTINGVWCWILLREGRRVASPALVADGRHLLSDVVSSAGVVAGVGLALATGWAVLDSLLALLVAGQIVWSGLRLIRESVGGLMDEAVSAPLLAKIEGVIAAHATGALEAHDLRTRQAGRMVFVEFHLVVPGEWSVAQAHGVCDQIEAALRGVSEGEVRSTIHVEPEEKAKGHRAPVIPLTV